MGSGSVSGQAALSPRRRWQRRLLRLGFLVALLALVYYMHPLLLASAGRWLDVSEAPPTVDDVMVLGGQANIRPFVAAALYNTGRARRVLVPTVKQLDADKEEGRPPEHEVIRRVLVKRGVPNEAIVLLPGLVDSTADEAAALARYLEGHPKHTVAVVTSNFHTRRARWTFRKQLGARAEQLHFVSGPTDGYDASNWWRSEEGCMLYLNEYAKLMFYLLKH